MALLNKYYIFVKEESKSRGVEVTSHPVEKGLDITDNVQKKAVTLSLEGEIVDVPKKKVTKSVSVADIESFPKWLQDYYVRNKMLKQTRVEVTSKTSAGDIEAAISKLHQNGKKVKYQGRYTLSNAIITSFDTRKNSEIKGGCFFTMTLQEIRIAKKAYKAKSKKKNKSVTKKKKKTYHKVKKGETLRKLAKKYYGSASKFKAIYKANKKAIDKKNKKLKVKNKYAIHKGMRLLIP